MRRLILGLILINLVIFNIIFLKLRESSLVAFLDVSQGNSVLIKSRNNVFLYDTGRWPFLSLRELDKFVPFYNRKIDVLLLSHTDKDHYLAAFEILKRYKVRLVGVSTLETSDNSFKNFLANVRKLKIPILVFKRGDLISDSHFYFLVLHPERSYKKENDNSLVIKVIGKKSYLLTGDIEKEGILSLISCCRNFLKSDYFLVPHHGSKNSIDENFYSLIKPDISVVSVGDNFYGHPHKETLDILMNFTQSKIIWRTDLNKTFVIKE